MKYGLITISILLCLSLVGIGFNYYRFDTEYSKTKDITNKIDEMNERISEIDNYLEENKNAYDEFIEQNKTKVEVYEKWLRMQKEVEEAL